jgi:thiol-disulfide isomerase/thioredoxin
MTSSDDPAGTTTARDERGRPDGALDRRYPRRGFLATVGATGVALAAGCLGDGTTPTDGAGAGDGTTPTDGAGAGDGAESTATGGTMDGTATESAMDETATDDGSGEGTDADWRTAELEAVRSGETFRIADLEHPVVVQTFAVWCPKCERQQDALAGVGDEATVVSLNVDGNEDGDTVAEHAANNEFDWRFAVAPVPITQSLIDEFGTDVTTPPTSPLAVVCGDGSTTFSSGSVLSTAQVTDMTDEC